MDETGFVVRHRWDNAFWLGFVATSWLAVAMGFLPPAMERYAGQAPYAAPTILVAHVFVYFAWLALLTLQVTLVNRRRIAWHQNVGIAGMGLAILVVATGFGAEIYSQRFWAQTDPENVRFFTFPLFVLVVFAICVPLAFRARRQPAVHKRLIYLGTAAIMGGPYQRWWGGAIDRLTGTGPFNTWAHYYAGINVFILIGAGFDLATRGTVHRVFRIAIPLLVAGQIAAIVIWYSAWWPPLVRTWLGIAAP
ncbi:hypothetical protein [Novosphingobium sp.]|uniref:hypothetical protein n=1 Tax=Novosphingobium sp. TaxID=1874826 RepID=UPI00286AAAAE|nr:hypothetical protein [Novosphingobium sp.]